MFALQMPTCWYLKCPVDPMRTVAEPMQANRIKFTLGIKGWVCVGHVDFMLFVSFFWWNTDFITLNTAKLLLVSMMVLGSFVALILSLPCFILHYFFVRLMYANIDDWAFGILLKGIAQQPTITRIEYVSTKDFLSLCCEEKIFFM